MMSPKEVETRATKIRQLRDRDEFMAKIMAERLFTEVLTAIEAGHASPQSLARAALKANLD